MDAGSVRAGHDRVGFTEGECVMRWIPILLLLSACGHNAEQLPDGAVDVANGGGSGTVQLIHLKDGTPCAVLIGYKKGSIDCGWR